jgi:hypothetical protein
MSGLDITFLLELLDLDWSSAWRDWIVNWRALAIVGIYIIIALAISFNIQMYRRQRRIMDIVTGAEDPGDYTIYMHETGRSNDMVILKYNSLGNQVIKGRYMKRNKRRADGVEITSNESVLFAEAEMQNVRRIIEKGFVAIFNGPTPESQTTTNTIYIIKHK